MTFGRLRYPLLMGFAVTFLGAMAFSSAEENSGKPSGGSNVPARWLQQMDANGDGKLARSETSGLMARFFDQNDANADGMLDGEELKAIALRLAERRGGNGANANREMPNRNRPGMESGGAVPDDVTILRDLAYRDGDESEAWKLDLVMPKEPADAPRPGIVFIHGGGWRSGDKGRGTFFQGAVEYAQEGYVCITINYRLITEAPFPACIEDVKCAVRWFRAHAEEYGVDPDRIGGYGNSAGAHLVAMLGLAGPEAGLEGDGPWQDQSSALQAVCASATPTDFSLFPRPRGGDTKFVNEKYDSAELAKLSSPITHVREDAPPFFLIHGTADGTVNVRHGDAFVEALKKAGAKDVEYLRIEGAGHGVFTQHRDQTGPAMKAFFARTLGEK